jgi:hypothetical protein
MVSDNAHHHAADLPATEQLGDGFSPPAAQAQPSSLGEPDLLAAAAQTGPALGSQSAF